MSNDMANIISRTKLGPNRDGFRLMVLTVVEVPTKVLTVLTKVLMVLKVLEVITSIIGKVRPSRLVKVGPSRIDKTRLLEADDDHGSVI